MNPTYISKSIFLVFIITQHVSFIYPICFSTVEELNILK